MKARVAEISYRYSLAAEGAALLSSFNVEAEVTP
jgi:hypothetical protein